MSDDDTLKATKQVTVTVTVTRAEGAVWCDTHRHVHPPLSQFAPQEGQEDNVASKIRCGRSDWRPVYRESES